MSWELCRAMCVPLDVQGQSINSHVSLQIKKQNETRSPGTTATRGLAKAYLHFMETFGLKEINVWIISSYKVMWI